MKNQKIITKEFYKKVIILFSIFFFLTGVIFSQNSGSVNVGNVNNKESGSINVSNVNNGSSSSAGTEGVSVVAMCIAQASGFTSAGSSMQTMFVQNNNTFSQITTGADMWKNCIMDGLANVLKRTIIRSLVKSTVDWINSGFEGKPAYAANLSRSLKKTTDSLLGEIIYQNKNLQFLCSEFEFPIKVALNLQFARGNFQEFDYTPKCKISDVVDNVKGALEDGKNYYSNTSNFFKITRGDDNIYTTYFKLSKEVDRIIKEREGRREKELDRGGGFFAFRDCSGTVKEYDGSVESEYKCPITTPGKLLSERLAKATNTETDELITADEFDEIIGAILNQVFQKILSSVGVSGFSEPDESGNNRSDLFIESGEKADEKTLDAFQSGITSSSYDPKRADIMLNTLNSMLKTLENAKKVLEDSKTCWESKETGYQKNSGSYYEVLIGSTKEESIEFADTNLDFVKSQIADLKKDIIRVENNIGKYKKIGEKVKAADSPSEVNKILNSEVTEDIRFIDNIQPVITKKTNLERKLQDIVNGKTSYTSARMEKKGGANASLTYCSGFDDKSYYSDYNRVNGRNSVSLSSLTNNSINNFVDPYDPVSDLETLNPNNTDNSNNNTDGNTTDNGNKDKSNELKMLVDKGSLNYSLLSSEEKYLVDLFEKRGSFYESRCITTYKKGYDVVVYNSLQLHKLVCKYSQPKRYIRMDGMMRDYTVNEKSKGEGPCNNDLVFDLGTRRMKFAQLTPGCKNN